LLFKDNFKPQKELNKFSMLKNYVKWIFIRLEH